MLNYLEYSCPVCNHPFKQEDDVVFCPECGAPHHRECFKQTGKCAFSDTHGTPEQWKPVPSRSDEDSVICSNCGTANAQDSKACSKCGHSLIETAYEQTLNPRASTYSSRNGSLTEMDAAAFIGPRSEYYLSRFHLIETQHNRLSWNWCAAFFPIEWLLYRKMMKPFIIALSIMMILMTPSIMIVIESCRAVAGDLDAMRAFMESGIAPTEAIPSWLNLLSDIAGVLSLGLRCVIAFKANDFYRRHVYREIEQIKKESNDPLYYRYTLTKKGGTSPGRVALFFVILAVAAIISAVLLSLCML